MDLIPLLAGCAHMPYSGGDGIQVWVNPRHVDVEVRVYDLDLYIIDLIKM